MKFLNMFSIFQSPCTLHEAPALRYERGKKLRNETKKMCLQLAKNKSTEIKKKVEQNDHHAK